jgi:hypothetical protein
MYGPFDAGCPHTDHLVAQEQLKNGSFQLLGLAGTAINTEEPGVTCDALAFNQSSLLAFVELVCNTINHHPLDA